MFTEAQAVRRHPSLCSPARLARGVLKVASLRASREGRAEGGGGINTTTKEDVGGNLTIFISLFFLLLKLSFTFQSLAVIGIDILIEKNVKLVTH